MAQVNIRLPSGEVVPIDFTAAEIEQLRALPPGGADQFATPRNVKAAEIAVNKGALPPELLGSERVPVGPSPRGPGIPGTPGIPGPVIDLAQTALAQAGIGARNIASAFGALPEEQALSENQQARAFIESINSPGLNLGDIGRVIPEAALIAGTGGTTIPRLTGAAATVSGLTADPGRTAAAAGLGAVGGFLGGGVGSILSRLGGAIPEALGAFGISQRIRNILGGGPGATRTRAGEVLRREGLRPTPAEATGSEALRGVEAGLARRPSTAPAALAIAGERQQALNTAAARAIGQPGKVVDEQVLGQAAKDIGATFERFTPDRITLGIQAQQDLARLPFTVANERTRRAIQNEIDNVLSGIGKNIDTAGGTIGRLGKEEFQSIRSQLVEAFQDASRTQGAGQLAERLRRAVDTLDNELIASAEAAGIQGARPALTQAREQFRLLRLFETRGAAITQGGNVNVTSMIRALQSPTGLGTTVSRGLERARLTPEAASFVELTRALSNREFVSIIPNSGTPTGQFIGELVQADSSGLVREVVAAAVARTFFGTSAVPGAFVGSLVRPFAQSQLIQAGRQVGAGLGGQVRGPDLEEGGDILSNILEELLQ